jgi:5-methylcytosine-specific restriction endonuclease McrA
LSDQPNSQSEPNEARRAKRRAKEARKRARRRARKLGLPIPEFEVSKGGRPSLPAEQRLSREEAQRRQVESRRRSQTKHRERNNRIARERSAATRAERLAVKEQKLAERRQWRIDHADEIKEHKRALILVWRNANREKLRATSRATKAKRGRERNRLAWKAWKAANPELYRAKCARRKARMRSAMVVEKIVPLDIFERDGWLCYLCGNPADVTTATLDHIIPVSHGGHHSAANCRCAHYLCNSRKCDKTIAELLGWADGNGIALPTRLVTVRPPPKPKRPRGRPRKHPLPEQAPIGGAKLEPMTSGNRAPTDFLTWRNC